MEKELYKLHQACRKGEIQQVLQTLTPFNINTCDENGRTLLHKAVQTKNYYLMNLLINYGAAINTRDRFDKTPLITAIELKSTIMVERIFKIPSFNRNIFSNSFMIPLHLALEKSCSLKLIYILLINGADPNQLDHNQMRPLYKACIKSNNNNKLLKLLIKFNANPNYVSKRGCIPLHAVCSWRSISSIEYLLRRTINLNQVDCYNLTPLDCFWTRLNNFLEYKTMEEKLETDYLIRCHHKLLSKCIERGCVLNRYLLEPFRLSASYYVIQNLLALLKALFTIKRPLKDYIRDVDALIKFTRRTLCFLIEKMTVKYAFLVRNLINYEIKNELTLFKMELKDFLAELIQLKQVVYILLSSGQFVANTFLVEQVFENYINTGQILSEESPFYDQNFSCLFDLNFLTRHKIQTFISHRKMFLTILYNYFVDTYQSKPLKLQELARILIKNHLRVFDKITVRRNLNLTESVNKYLFYEI